MVRGAMVKDLWVQVPSRVKFTIQKLRRVIFNYTTYSSVDANSSTGVMVAHQLAKLKVGVQFPCAATKKIFSYKFNNLLSSAG